MPIEERVMTSGRWSVTLSSETPPALLYPLTKGADGSRGFFGHMFFTPVDVLGGGRADDDMRAMSTYTGVVREISSAEGEPTTIGGPGLRMWLGDDEGKGPILGLSDIFPTAIEFEDSNFVDAVTALIPPSLEIGTLTEPALPPGGLFTYAAVSVTPAVVLADIMTWFDCEYVVNPDFTVDAGPAATVFPKSAAPSCVAIRRRSGADPALIGLQTTNLSVVDDANSYYTRIGIAGRTGGFAIAIGSADTVPSTPYLDFFGNTVDFAKLEDAPGIVADASLYQGLADQIAAQGPKLHRQIQLQTDDYHIFGVARAGDSIYVYDPVRGLYDEDNQLAFRGEIIYPVKERLYALTMPIKRGMGVYFRDRDGRYWDLTNWVQWEDSGDADTTAPEVLTELQRQIELFNLVKKGKTGSD